MLGIKVWADIILVPAGTTKTRCGAPALASFGSIARSASIPEVLISCDDVIVICSIISQLFVYFCEALCERRAHNLNKVEGFIGDNRYIRSQVQDSVVIALLGEVCMLCGKDKNI